MMPFGPVLRRSLPVGGVWVVWVCGCVDVCVRVRACVRMCARVRARVYGCAYICVSTCICVCQHVYTSSVHKRPAIRMELPSGALEHLGQQLQLQL